MPATGADVIIPSTTGNPTINTSGLTISIGSLVSADPIKMNGGSLTVTDTTPSHLTAGLILQGGTLGVNAATLVIDGSTIVSGGSLTATNSGTLTLNTATALTQVNLTASGDGQLLFPAATSYANSLCQQHVGEQLYDPGHGQQQPNQPVVADELCGHQQRGLSVRRQHQCHGQRRRRS